MSKRFYGRRWDAARKRFLSKFPLCKMCLDVGRITNAVLVDHIEPHKGDYQLFWREDNWQPLCRFCHDSAKKKLEMTGVLKGGDVNGHPVDPNHHWNKT